MTPKQQLALTKTAATRFTSSRQGYMNLMARDKTVSTPLWDKLHQVIYDTKRPAGGLSIPGNRQVWITPERRDYGTKAWRRSIIAHEAFHAQNPTLGKSEALAYGYGGWRAPRPGASITDRLASTLGGLHQYFAGGIAPAGTQTIGAKATAVGAKMLAPLWKSQYGHIL